MSEEYSVTLKEIVDDFQLEIISGHNRIYDVKITTSDINRPGLQLTGYMENFGSERMQIVGMVETSYISGMTSDERYKRLDAYFKLGFPCVIVTRGLDVFEEMIEISNKYQIPIVRTRDITSNFVSGIIKYLNVQLAPRIVRHGVMIEVYGEGILILGESGVGKSETAMELVKRGHRLIADDVVEIRRVSDTTLLGTAPDIIRHFVEIRGIGILDVKNLYGMGSVKVQETVNLIIHLELWDKNKSYDRLGIDDEYTDILGIKIPSLTIPVRPGRNLAIIVELAAMNNRQKSMGYNAAKVLNERINSRMMGEISRRKKER
ncbi:MAG TPA: HPr(Ser) kinase/phosphatase [Clostridiales bacterium]|nr:HPr(Ser) kinase/phosphatase [Clostridiales bacterium]